MHTDMHLHTHTLSLLREGRGNRERRRSGKSKKLNMAGIMKKICASASWYSPRTIMERVGKATDGEMVAQPG